MEKPKSDSVEKAISEINDDVETLAEKMKLEGYIFDLNIINQNQISLKIMGDEELDITFTKLKPYPIMKDGEKTTTTLKERIEKIIREFAPKIEKE